VYSEIASLSDFQKKFPVKLMKILQRRQRFSPWHRCRSEKRKHQEREFLHFPPRLLVPLLLPPLAAVSWRL
jgi:hypothetical protein